MSDATRSLGLGRAVLLPGFRLTVEGGEPVTFLEGRVVIGSDPDVSLHIASDTVSRGHCRLDHRPAGIVLRDLDSTNGTWVGGVRIREAWLDKACTFVVGDVPVLFEPAEEVLEAAPAASERLGDLVGRAPATLEFFNWLERIGPTDATVLLEGETGTGKEVAARTLHARSCRSDGPFVVVDCSALPRELAEAELFGHEKGSFTGAVSGRQGLVELADGGTLFLDEVGELPLELQPLLLRFLESREFRRVGGRQTRAVDIRVVAATNRDLRAEVDQGRFRADLLYRLDVVRLHLPPLRERPEDLPLLVEFFLQGKSVRGRRKGVVAAGFDDDAWALLRTHPWPGNVRELRNVVERAMALAVGPLAGTDTLPPEMAGSRTGAVAEKGGASYRASKARATAQFEREYLRELMRRSGSNLSRAARLASMDRKHLRELLRKHDM